MSTRRTSLVAAALAAGLYGSLVGAAEDRAAPDQPAWGEWRPLGGGFVARRRQPPGLAQAATERRDPSQVPGAGAKRLAGATVASAAVADPSRTAKAVWLMTGHSGLFQASIADLAASLARNERQVRKFASRGRLELTHAPSEDAAEASSGVSWHYDPLRDRILFAATPYQSFQTPEDAYRLRLGTSRSPLVKPMAVSAGEPPAAGGTAAPFTETLHFEEEPAMMFLTWAVADEPDADYWFWDMLVGGSRPAIDLPLAVPHPAPTGEASLRVTLRGFTNLVEGDDHLVTATLNGQPIGSVSWDGAEEATLSAQFDQSILLGNGEDILSLSNAQGPAGTPGQFLDAIELRYQRMPVAEQGALWLKGAAGGIQSVSGLPGEDLLLIENPGGESVWRQDFSASPDGNGGWSVSFTASAGQDYLVSTAGKAHSPRHRPDYPSNLDDRKNRAEYLIIAPPEFAGTAQRLADHRRASHGEVMIAWLDDIFDQYSAGRSDPAALARFMQNAVDRWQLAPSTVVLLGRGSLDGLDRMGLGGNHLPVVMTANPWALAASDSRLLGFEFDPPFAIGRLPIISDAEGLAYLDKLARHETQPTDPGAWTALLVADNPDDGGDFHAVSEYTAQRLAGEFGFSGVERLYHPQLPVSEALTRSDSWEHALVSYAGHGSTAQTGNSRENFMLASSVATLANNGLPVFSALTCAVGDDSVPGVRSLAGALVLNPDGGAIAALAPTGLSLDADAQLLGNAFLDSLLGEGAPVGTAVAAAKARSSATLQPFMAPMYSVVGEPAVRARQATPGT